MKVATWRGSDTFTIDDAPEPAVKRLAVRASDIGPAWSKIRWAEAFVRSDGYIVHVRVVGIGAYIMAALLMFGLYKRL
jgi:hypothetical protein